jgi:hypothetical protein
MSPLPGFLGLAWSLALLVGGQENQLIFGGLISKRRRQLHGFLGGAYDEAVIIVPAAVKQVDLVVFIQEEEEIVPQEFHAIHCMFR